MKTKNGRTKRKTKNKKVNKSFLQNASCDTAQNISAENLKLVDDMHKANTYLDFLTRMSLKINYQLLTASDGIHQMSAKREKELTLNKVNKQAQHKQIKKGRPG